MKNNKEYVTEIAETARNEFKIYNALSPEEKHNYEKLINYQQDKIVLTDARYSKEAYIYCLYDPTGTSKTCYVGVSHNTETRLKRHLGSHDNCNPYKKAWVRSLVNKGIEIELIIIDTLSALDPWQLYESFYIAYFKHVGIKLCNATLGGEGTVGHKHSDQSKELMRQKKIGHVQSEETVRKRMRVLPVEKIKELYLEGYSLNELSETYNTCKETISYRLEKAGIPIREEKLNERAKEKLRVANIGKVLSDETKQKIGESNLGNIHTQETRNNMSNIRKNQIAAGEFKMPLHRASGKDAGTYRDDELLLKLHGEGMSLRKIGETVNMEHHSIKDRLIKAGVKFETQRNKDTSNFIFDIESALEMYKNGYSCNRIGKELSCDNKSVKKHLEKAGIVFAAANNGNKGLDDKMDKIKELYDSNLTFSEIGRMFNASGTTIKTYLKKYDIL